MKTLGIIGGVGPESTMDYYRTIIGLYRERIPDGSYPSLLINSIDLKTEMEFVVRNDIGGLASYITADIEKLARAGAQFGLIASNTPHLAFEEIAAKSPIPLLSIVEAACDVAVMKKLKKVALFGTTFTMRGDFYPKVFARTGIELVKPDAADQEFIHDKYMNELVNGIFRDDTRAHLLAIVDKLKQNRGIDGLILAGTELPLTLRQPAHNDIPFLNTTLIHCRAAVSEMVS